jgi:hypothetical protein
VLDWTCWPKDRTHFMSSKPRLTAPDRPQISSGHLPRAALDEEAEDCVTTAEVGTEIPEAIQWMSRGAETASRSSTPREIAEPSGVNKPMVRTGRRRQT